VTRILVVTAVEAERASVLNGLGPIGLSIDINAPSTRRSGIDVICGGVGPAAAAAATAVTLGVAEVLGWPYDHVVCMGIGGAFPDRAAFGEIVVGTASIAADLGAQSPDGFLSVTDLGFGRNVIEANQVLVSDVIAGIGAAKFGAILTVTTATGSTERADELSRRHPNALVEAMEGYGVACAADVTRTPFAEIRTISNAVGLRDRTAWRIPDALAALSKAATGVAATVATT
jgi:futalosine hydrolase